MSKSHPYWLRATYGPGGRAGIPNHPNLGRVGEREGDLAFHLVYSNPDIRKMDEDIARARPDLIVEVGQDGVYG